MKESLDGLPSKINCSPIKFKPYKFDILESFKENYTPLPYEFLKYGPIEFIPMTGIIQIKEE